MSSIQSWHAHIYYDPTSTRPVAEALRAEIAARFDVVLGRWHDVPVGPHPQAMYQIALQPAVFAELAGFLALHRHGLTVLIHPNTGDEVADHRDHAMWLGAILPLNLAALAHDH